MKTLLQYTLLVMLAVSTAFFMFSTEGYSQNSGLIPQTTDGFETGDWRNFRPHYIGNSNEFIRPQFTINDSNPISGNYSLRWQTDGQEHEWVKVSNTFYLELPAKVSIDFRVEAGDTDWSVGLRLLETYQRFTGIRFSPRGNGRFHLSLEELSGLASVVHAENGGVYRLTLRRFDDDDIQATLIDVSTGQVMAKLNGLSSVRPEAIGIHVYTGADSEAVMDFDNITVESAPYRLQSGKWTRSPHFVVLPQLPDVAEDQGNWVGAQSTIKKDDEYLMWYRRRDNVDRGRGSGFARSEDGLHWEKYENNPIFTYDDVEFSSSEKIHVLYVDGLYRAWYAVNAPGSWYTAYATSEGGVNWEQHGLVLDDTYTKDVDVVYHEGLYYLYSIKENDNLGIYTSTDGMDWEHNNTIPLGVHRHVAATYVKKTGEFHVYVTGGFAGVSQAVSKDGINFGPFRKVMDASKVGLDDWSDAGVTYLSFLTDEHGKIDDDRQMPIYYQARNTWDNNIPGWLFHGSERVVLAGHYDGIFLGIPTTVLPDGSYEYHRFPFEVPRADGLEIFASRETEVRLDSWETDSLIMYEGSLTAHEAGRGHSGEVNTQVQWELTKLFPGEEVELVLNGENVSRKQADSNGKLVLTEIVNGNNGPVTFRVQKVSE